MEISRRKKILFKLFNCESSTLIEYRWVEDEEGGGGGEGKNALNYWIAMGSCGLMASENNKKLGFLFIISG